MSDDGAVSDFGISPPGAPGARPRPLRRQLVSNRDDLAAALRRLIRATVASRLPEESVADAVRTLEALSGRLEAAAGEGRPPRVQPDPDGHPQDFFPTSPVVGFANPVAPPVELAVDGASLVGEVTLDVPYEGPPGCVHGGVIALLFDEMLGAANILVGHPAMTGTLTIRYRKPTPLGVPLRLEAHYVGHEGRKVHTVGTIHAGDVLTAEAEGIFVELGPRRFERLLAEERRAGPV